MTNSLLYVSDDPEAFRSHGKLFHAPLRRETPARILFDHVNGTSLDGGAGTAIRLAAYITNVGAAQARFAIAGAAAHIDAPEANGMEVGHRVAVGYFNACLKPGHPGLTTVTLAPNASHALADVVLQPGPPDKPGGCVAGTFDVQPASDGGQLEIRVIACDPARDPAADRSLFDDLPDSPSDGRNRRGVFDISGAPATMTISRTGGPATIGPQHQFYPHVASDTYPGPGHTGEYGVVKRYTCLIDGDQPLALAQSARGNAGATATYLIGDELVESHQFGPNAFLRIRSFDPRQARGHVDVVTMAEINSTLPVELALLQDDERIADAPLVRATA